MRKTYSSHIHSLDAYRSLHSMLGSMKHPIKCMAYMLSWKQVIKHDLVRILMSYAHKEQEKYSYNNT